MAKKFHPDINKAADAKEKFAELNTAYQTLADDNKRRMYDMTGSSEGADYGGMGGGDPFSGGGGGGMGGMSREQAEEIFSQFFGRGGPFGGDFSSAFGGGDPFSGGGMGGGAPRGPRNGADVRKSIRISLKEAVLGTTKDLRINKPIQCTPCGGTGVKSGTKPKTCTKCNGTGTMTMQQGFFIMRTTCDACDGTGHTHDNCPSCGGEGYKSELKTVEVKIPPGVDTGTILRLPSLGSIGQRGGSPGDMFLEIYVEADRNFTRKGDDLDTKVNISLAQAILGGSVNIQTIADETVQVTIPQGAQHGDKVVLKGKGIKPKNKFSAGNLNINLNIQIPKNLSEEQRELFELYAQTEKDRSGTVNAPAAGDEEKKSGFFQNLKAKLHKKE